MADQSTPAKKKRLVSRTAKAIEDAINTAVAGGAVNQMTGVGRNPLTEKRVVMGLHQEEDAQEEDAQEEDAQEEDAQEEDAQRR